MNGEKLQDKCKFLACPFLMRLNFPPVVVRRQAVGIEQEPAFLPAAKVDSRSAGPEKTPSLGSRAGAATQTGFDDASSSAYWAALASCPGYKGYAEVMACGVRSSQPEGWGR